MANIKLTELSELTTSNNTNTIFYVADLSVSPNVSHYIRLGTFTSDNAIAYIAYGEANAAFLRANTALSVAWNANIAFNQANSAYNQANATFNQANTAASFANGAFTRANNEPIGTSAASFANGAFARANSSYDFANTAYTRANNNSSFANSAFVTGNSAASFANGAFARANSSYDFANGAFARANSSYGFANLSYNHANSAYDFANTISGSGAFDRANAAFRQANNAFNVTNVAFNTANSAASFANGAFTRANNSVLKTGDAISGVVTAPTAANNSSNTMLATTRYVDNAVKNAITPGIIKAYATVSISGSVASLTRGFNISSVSRLGTGRYQINFTTLMSSTSYVVTGAVSTYNQGDSGNARNFDHTINIEATTTSAVIVNTGDPGAQGNNTGHDVARIWIMIVE